MKIEWNNVCQKLSAQWVLCKSSVISSLSICSCGVCACLHHYSRSSLTVMTVKHKGQNHYQIMLQKTLRQPTVLYSLKMAMNHFMKHVSMSLGFLMSCHHRSTPEPPAAEVFSQKWQGWEWICPRELRTSSFPSVTPSLGSSCPHRGVGQIPHPSPS